jgi:adenylate cyclase
VVDDSSFWTAGEAEWGEEANWFDTLLAAGTLKDKIVFVGASMRELHDYKLTPFSGGGGQEAVEVPGVEVHAAALHTLLEGHRIAEARVWLVYMLLFLLCVVIYVLGTTTRTVVYLLSVVLIGAAWWVAALQAYGSHAVLVPVVTPLLCIALVTAGQQAYLFYLEQVRRREVIGMFGRYVPREVVRELVRHPEKVKLGGQRRELTVLFCDLEGFTTICEGMPPEQVVEFLNEYLTVMTEIVQSERGIIDKYEGDLIMAEFGIPLAMPDHALRACRTAFRMQRRLDELREQWEAEGKPSLRARVGIGSGTMVFGNVGSSQAFDYTVLGDVVNLASRLEGANKTYGTSVMINERTHELVREHIVVREIDLLLVKGKQHPEKCFELMAPADAPDAEQLTTVAGLFTEGLHLYRRQQWDEAVAKFERVLELRPDDTPSKTFVERCQRFRAEPPGADWNGVFALQTK